MRALTDVFAEANGDVVENAVSAVNALGSLDRCADVPLLRSVVRPPEDPTTRARVEDLRRRLAGLKARYDAGRWKEVVQQMPGLVAEARRHRLPAAGGGDAGAGGDRVAESNDSKAAERAFVEAFWAADGSRHDEVRAEAASYLVFVFGFQEGHFEEAERWSKTAEAVLKRIGGHDLLHSWLLNDMGSVLTCAATDGGAALRTRLAGDEGEGAGPRAPRRRRLREQPGDGAGRAVAEPGGADARRPIDLLLENGLGAGHPDMATQLSNRGEILDALGRHRRRGSPSSRRASSGSASSAWTPATWRTR